MKLLAPDYGLAAAIVRVCDRAVKLLIFNAKLIILNTKFIILNTKFIICDTQFITFTTKFTCSLQSGSH